MYNTNGLKEDEVKESRKRYGSNSINEKNKNTFFNLFIETLGDPIIKILLIALAIKTIFLFRDFDYFETMGIVLAVLVASLISAISEYGSNKAFQRMQEESSRINVLVKRDGKTKEITIDEIVKNDILILAPGNKVPADGILIKGKLSVDESSLNGETKEVYKEYIDNISLATEKNRVYRGTTIYDGEALILVTKIGMDTLYGKMAKVLTEEEDASPLKLRLTNLAKIISRIGYIAAILIAVAYLFSKIFIINNFNLTIIRETITLNKFFSLILEALTLAVSVLVMSVPEGLPMMITLVLSTNSKKMLKDNVLVRKMVGIETAGSLNILFTDKTGTLTKGKMEVSSIIDGNLNEYNDLYYTPDKLKTLISDSLLYNNESELEESSGKVVGGNLTDKALLSFVQRKKDNSVLIKDRILFNSKNKFAVTIIEKNNEKIKLIKGAPDIVIKNSTHYIDKDGKRRTLDKDKILNYVNSKADSGLRAIALAISQSIYPTDSIRRNILLGVIFLKDDIRPEAKDGVSLIKSAGINIVMVTGDSKETATSIAKEIGIITSNNDIVLSSSDLEKLSDNELKKIIPNLKVVSRALPEDKKRLVMLSKELGLVTGMTGDGVNDSIALKKADVSFAMGSGTEVSKEASDIVIIDDNILSISRAILYGRTTFKNIRKFIIFQLTVNISAIMLALIGPFIGVPSPITVLQMLWINMVMDTLAGLAFSYEVPRIEYMKEPPKKKEENIINKYMFNEIIATSMYTLIISLLFLKLPFIKYIVSSDHLMTAFFSLFIFIAVFNSFNARTHRLNILAHLKENKVFILIIIFIIIVQIIIIYSGITLFQTKPLYIKELIFILVLSLSIIPFDFLRKYISKKLRGDFGV
ncbi:MAG TPA: calcium-translocating P-type ATPase, PMCA-type [Firmicutes bacterium]|nr:calcium-translocating P-type ATPase, PMCA-type [Bacillota bacterium]